MRMFLDTRWSFLFFAVASVCRTLHASLAWTQPISSATWWGKRHKNDFSRYIQTSPERNMQGHKDGDSVKKKTALPVFPKVWLQSNETNYNQAGNKEFPQGWIPFQHEESNSAFCPMGRAVNATMRWCTNFVEPLKLCPWTCGCITTPGAIAIYVVEGASEASMTSAVRIASLRLQEDVETGKVSSKVAISFVIAGDNQEWDFGSFYEWFVSFEDELLDEAEENEEAIGNYVTIAPFHPDWEFGQHENEALAFEKKSPLPTVSIVCTSEIELAGVDATTRIGIHNEKVLTEMGVSSLEENYQDNVLLNPSQDPQEPNS